MSEIAARRPGQPAIAIAGVVKRYRLHQKPVYRFLDLFGMCPTGPGYYSEHTALNDVTLTVARGEKVAIIGRNGAGKSTLLKVVTGLVRPNAGSVRVDGTVSNLLQIGSGFHPDFTGRQNVYASLAHQGITGAEATRIFREVADFAEIGEYIDQPMKTYSTGMCSRLMFSSSVVTRPDILIVDEILGVGDAYFSHKSFERMRQLCADEGTTLLLVTHNIYAALNLCDRFVWLDRGHVMFDGDGKAAISLYESSVKDQEEQALRHHNVATLVPEDDAQSVVHVLVRSHTGFALDRPAALQRIELLMKDGSRTALPVAEGAAGWMLVPEGNLGRSEVVAGQSCRLLRTTGSIYHKAEWIVTLPTRSAIAAVGLKYRYEGMEPLDVRVFTPDRKLLAAGELPTAADWTTTTIPGGKEKSELEVLKQTNYGTGAVRIVRVQFIDRDGRDVVEVRHGEAFTVRAELSVQPELIGRTVTLILGFARHESPYSAYVYEPRLTLCAAETCIVEVRLDAVQLGSGQWYVNLGFGEVGLYERDVINYFTVDGAWYHMLAGRLELRVTSETKVDTFGCFFVHPARVAVLESTPVAAGEPHS
jgi:ABC-type polysaccharide/polyol phosphate transport system ATPase subunit